MNHSSIRLRAIEPEHLDILYEIENDRELWDVGATNVPYSRYSLHNYIATQTSDIYADRQLRLMIENEKGQTVGIADLMNFDPQHRRAEVGIVVMTAWRRQGYAAEALAQLVRYSVERLHLHQLYAFVAADNEASLALFRQSGFTSGSLLSDWLFDGREYHDALLLQLFL